MKKRLIMIFFIFSLAIYTILSYNKHARIEQYLQAQTNKFVLAYNSIYGSQKDLANIIKNLIIKNQRIIDIYKQLQTASARKKDTLRKELYEYVRYYFGVTLNYKTSLLHFHLKDNKSFLRMHKPQKYGDSLAKIRPMVVRVNKYFIPVDGFEQGRFYDAYRFVYPIENKGEHLGSVEISIPAEVIVKKFIKNYDVIANFLIKKTVIDTRVYSANRDRYKKSFYNKFYFDKKILSQIGDDNSAELNELSISKEKSDFLQKKILNRQNYTVYLPNTKSTLTVISVIDPATNSVDAFISIREKSEFVSAININFITVFCVLELLLFVVLLFIYRQNQLNVSLRIKKDLVQNILDAVPNLTFVTDFKKAIYVNFVFLNFFNVMSADEFNKEHDNILDIFLPWDNYLHLEEGATKEEFVNSLIDADSSNRKVMIFDRHFNLKAFEILISKIRYDNRSLYLLTLVDITKQELESKKIEHKAYHDGLTGVYNRNKFNELFEIELRKSRRYNTKFLTSSLSSNKK